MLDADDSTSDLGAYLAAQGLDHLEAYCRDNSSNKWCVAVGSGGFAYAPSSDGGYPKTVFMDRDGNIRQYVYGAFDGSPGFYLNVIKQLLGVS